MTINIETAIKNMYDLKAKGISYSMNGSRTGSDGTGDCSGTIYDSLRKAGATDAGWILNTDSMHPWLVNNGFTLIAENKEWTAQRGDIVIFGKKGSSGGAAGHVVIFISNTQIIHCTWKSEWANGVYVDNEATTCPYSMGFYVYRLSENQEPAYTLKWIKDAVGYYLVDSQGNYPVNWQMYGGTWYFINPDTGYMHIGWLKDDLDRWYYFDGSGAMRTGWVMVVGKWYHFDSNGYMAEGWLPQNGAWYYMQKDGSMKQGWFTDQGGNTYYLSSPSGMMVTGTQSIDGKRYEFDVDGKLIK